MSKEHSGNQKLDYPKVTIEENCLEEEPAVNFVPAEDQITGNLTWNHSSAYKLSTVLNFALEQSSFVNSRVRS